MVRLLFFLHEQDNGEATTRTRMNNNGYNKSTNFERHARIEHDTNRKKKRRRSIWDIQRWTNWMELQTNLDIVLLCHYMNRSAFCFFYVVCNTTIFCAFLPINSKSLAFVINLLHMKVVVSGQNRRMLSGFTKLWECRTKAIVCFSTKKKQQPNECVCRE